MKTVKILTLSVFFFSFLVPLMTTAQAPLTYKGHVTGENGTEALEGVNIVLLSKGTGTQTNAQGYFELQATPGEAIQLTYVGHEPINYILGNETTINFTMKVADQVGEEVIVVGYGTQKQKDLTSAITTISSDDIMKTPTGQAMQSLQGIAPGVQIVSSGAPGSAPTVRVRGIGSYPGVSNSAPLYVVDGMFFDNIDFLNPSDIATISVLKDASAAAIYGVRAANGVILVETKSGRKNQPAQITYEGYYGVQVPTNVLQMANSEQYAQMASELDPSRYPDYQYILKAMQLYGRSKVNPNVPDVNTDWYKEIMRVAPIQNHSINVSGGSDKATYSVGGSYFGQDGILDMKNDFQRFNLRTKLDYQALKWLTVGGNILFSNGLNYQPESGAWRSAYFAVPILPVYDYDNPDAFPIPYSSAQVLGYRSGQNPFPSMEFIQNKQKLRNTFANFYVKVDLIPNKLNFKTSYNHNFSALDLRRVELPYYNSAGAQRPDARITRTWDQFSNQFWDNLLTYDDHTGKHNYTVMLGTSFRDEEWTQLRAAAVDFPPGQEQSWYLAQAQTIDINSVGDNGSHYYGFSYFGRVAYNYDHKYLLYGTFRSDGSNKYQQKSGFFPTVGAGWVLTEEDFFKVKGIDYLKIRGSWGRLGNDKIPASDGKKATTVVNTTLGDKYVPGAQTSETFSWLEWEVVEEINVGLSARFADNRLNMEADYFTRDTKNAAIAVKIPVVGGTVLRNAGIINNSGVELGLNWNDKIGNDLTYQIGANIATLKNEVKDLFGQPYLDGPSAEFSQRSLVGHPLLAFFGYKVAGVYQNQGEIDADPIDNKSDLKPGYFKYQNTNGDKLLDGDDRVLLGSYFPNLTYGFNIGAGFKNFSLTANFYGQSGNKIMNRKRGEVHWTNDLNIDADLAKNRWHGEGTSNKYPSANGLREGWNQMMSDYFVEDGSFFRIQNVMLSYSLAKGKLFNPGFPEMRISLTADRPATFFKYNGFNAEVPDGIDNQTYPIPAVYTVGLNIRF